MFYLDNSIGVPFPISKDYQIVNVADACRLILMSLEWIGIEDSLEVSFNP